MSNRINVTFDKETYNELYNLAAYKEISMSELIRECVADQLENLEDRYLSKLADERIEQGKKETYISHGDAWKDSV